MPQSLRCAIGIATALALLAAGGLAQASTQGTIRGPLAYDGGRLTLDLANGHCEITLSGEINPAAVRQLSYALAEMEKATCHRRRMTLHSVHGVVNSAITVGAMLRNRNFDTRITDGSVCLTPCALVFMSGRQRLLSSGGLPARIAFQPIPSDRDFGASACRSELTRAQTLTLSRYLRAMLPDRAATAVLHKIGTADCRRIEYLGAHEAVALGLATGSWLQHARAQQ